MAEEKTQWKHCPKCNGFIPMGWDRHEKCGWNTNIDEVEDVEEGSSFEKKCNLLLECRDFVLKNFDIKDFPERHTFVNSLFIALNRNDKHGE